MQHDTSPHKAEIGGLIRKIQSASGVLCFSHMIFFQGYPRFRRFECKLFLTAAWRYFRGAAQETMIDNTHVIILRGTGRNMIPTAEMEAFGERYGTVFRAHAVGDANRKGRVERPFHFIENNFLAGRKFADWHDFNRQALAWCDTKNRMYRRHLKAKPIELYNLERTHLRPLPIWVPDPYLVHDRIVDVHGYVTIDTNRYSVSEKWIGKPVQALEGQSEIEISCTGEKSSFVHERHIEREGKWLTLPEHKGTRRQKKGSDPPKELARLVRQVPEIEGYLKKLRKRAKRSYGFALRQMLRMLSEYPRAIFLDAVRSAERYGLYDIDRLETMVLQRIDSDFFPLDRDRK